MAGPQQYLRIVTVGTALSTGESRTKKIYNVWDFIRQSSGGAPSKTAAATAFNTSIFTPLAACLSVSYVKLQSTVRWLDDPKDPFVNATGPVNGGVLGDSLPSVNNATLQLQSGVRGRSYRGSKHFGPIAEAHTTLDYLNSTALALWATFQTAYLAGMTGSDGFVYKPVIVSATLSKLTSTIATVVAVPVTGTIINAQLGIMRKRSQERTNTM